MGNKPGLDFNLSFYGYISGIQNNETETRKFGPPAHDQRGKNNIVGELKAEKGLGAVKEYLRLKKLAPAGPTLKASVPGPYTLSGRLLPNEKYKDRYAITEALLPMIRKELEELVSAGCTEITVDEPSMSCYAYKEDTKRFVDIFNRTVKLLLANAISVHIYALEILKGGRLVTGASNLCYPISSISLSMKYILKWRTANSRRSNYSNHLPKKCMLPLASST
jgi:5-methyltetrahydropteroyltriglutamate--homocysteine methyltransferase